ncbi:hypothetical protein [Macrococcus brunensis]|uniref:hypothetical protein n=1 Tax=Macrococcus brunensis TaxID=198483 RepID=UPI001EEFC798|nr:hypothetical protein [Macrococcus brunensis]ULG73889.1 hypothetical protein MGG13_09545 [Macrococcus brunensis]
MKAIATSFIALLLMGILLIVSLPYIKGEKEFFSSEDEQLKQVADAEMKSDESEDKKKSVKTVKADQKVETQELPEGLKQDTFDEVKRNLEEKSKLSSSELEEYIAYLQLMGLIAYLDYYEELYDIDVYSFYDISVDNVESYTIDDIDMSDYENDDEIEEEVLYNESDDYEETAEEFEDTSSDWEEDTGNTEEIETVEDDEDIATAEEELTEEATEEVFDEETTEEDLYEEESSEEIIEEETVELEETLGESDEITELE